MDDKWAVDQQPPGVLAVKKIRQQISLPNRLTHQSTTLTNEQRQWWTRAEHRRFKSGPQLMRGLNVHKNIPVSITKLTLGLRVGFISSHLIADKLFSVILEYCTTDSIPINLMFQENFPTHTQVWNCLSHRNDCRQRGVIWVTYRWCNSNPC